jgi:hypothetical protein
MSLSAALREHAGYVYSIATIVNTVERGTVEAELWYVLPGERQVDAGLRRRRYFRRSVDKTGAEASRRVEREFKEWVEGRQEAEPPCGV